MDRDTGYVVADHFTLSGVQPGVNLKSQRAHSLPDREGAAYRARRSVEGGKQPITRGVHVTATEGSNLLVQNRVEVGKQLAPLPVA